MPTFEIPTGSSISKNKLTYRIHKWKAPCAKAPKCGSFTYNHEKGGMTCEWADANAFLTWLTAEELEKAMELIVSQVEQSDSLICGSSACTGAPGNTQAGSTMITTGPPNGKGQSHQRRQAADAALLSNCIQTLTRSSGSTKRSMITRLAMRISALPDCWT